MRDIAGRFGTSRSALLRHKQTDIPKKLVKAKEAAEVVEAGTLFDRLREINQETKAILEQARTSGSLSVALAAINRVERQLELEARLLGQLHEGGGARFAVGIQVNTGNPDLSHLSDAQLAEMAQEAANHFRQRAGLDSAQDIAQ